MVASEGQQKGYVRDFIQLSEETLHLTLSDSEKHYGQRVDLQAMCDHNLPLILKRNIALLALCIGQRSNHHLAHRIMAGGRIRPSA